MSGVRPSRSATDTAMDTCHSAHRSAAAMSAGHRFPGYAIASWNQGGTRCFAYEPAAPVWRAERDGLQMDLRKELRLGVDRTCSCGCGGPKSTGLGKISWNATSNSSMKVVPLTCRSRHARAIYGVSVRRRQSASCSQAKVEFDIVLTACARGKQGRPPQWLWLRPRRRKSHAPSSTASYRPHSQANSRSPHSLSLRRRRRRQRAPPTTSEASRCTPYAAENLICKNEFQIRL